MNGQNPLSEMKCQGAGFCALPLSMIIRRRRANRWRQTVSQPASKIQPRPRGNLANATPLQ
ncbi:MULTISPECIES: hypothetical protein [unclassified Mesorhizobium]|uniref:hypothetical protein n=1 Tax=unclassified Mesorhizobium TaxID=325217 RepID=UPI00118010E3|nr:MULTISPECIES: hypothetical protein [unclassified Mesorhizobium]